jgi:predicted metal-dependent phosphoesterase TrpH
MKKISTVMLDMDGVLTNFHKGVHDIYGQKWVYDNRYIIYDFWKEWDIEVTREQVMERCDAKFWENLEWHHDGKDILNILLKKFDVEQIYLLTNPIIGGPDAATGKMKWVQREMPDFYRRVILTCAPKGLLAKPDVLMVDDFDHNIQNFKDAGGQTIQIARMWNKNHQASLDAAGIFDIELRRYENAGRHTKKV